MRSLLHWLFGRNQIFGGYNLPLPVASHPRVCPHEASSRLLAAPTLPRLVSLCYGGGAVEPDFDVVRVIAEKILRSLANVRHHLCLIIEAPLRIYTDEVVSQDALGRARVACRN